MSNTITITPSEFRSMNYSPDSFILLAWIYFISGLLVWPFACIVILDEYVGNTILGYPARWSDGTAMFFTGLLFAALAGWVVSTFACLALTYRCYAVIQDGGQARNTPAFACFLLLVPIFNILGMFHVWPGLAKDINKYADALNVDPTIRPGVGNAIFACLATILMFIVSFFVFAPFAFALARTAQAIQRKKIEMIGTTKPSV